MHCPVCKQTLNQKGTTLFCPNNHGQLVTGKFLSAIEESETNINSVTANNASNSRHKIMCPNCTNAMQKVDYNSNGIVIDACTNCHYRWLDMGEIRKIKNFKPTFKSEDLLFLMDIDAKTKTITNGANHNPKIPLFNTKRVVSAGDSTRSLGVLSGMALYGIITGMIKSKFLRIVIPLMLIFFALGFYQVFKSFGK